jgi:hypothetical protein
MEEESIKINYFLKKKMEEYPIKKINFILKKMEEDQKKFFLKKWKRIL